MTDTTLGRSCRIACEDLVAGRTPARLEGDAAVALRHVIREHGLSGMAAVAIDSGRLVLPEAIQCGIRQDWTAAMHHSLLLDGECSRIGRLVRGAGEGRSDLSPPILLKGPAVSRRYGNPSVRTYLDIDLLVPVEQVRSWTDLLAIAGYWAPTPEIRAVERRHREGCAFTRTTPAGELSIDLHTSVFIERHAREIGYRVLATMSEPSCFPGLLQTMPGAQLVVIALHLAHHGQADHRLIWYRDFIELGRPETVAAARRMAEEHQVPWALECALLAVEEIVGLPTWNARSLPAPRFGLASVHQLEQTEYLRHVALARELGFVAGVSYLCSRLDPRRFVLPGGGFDWSAARAWAWRAVTRARNTPWSRVWGRDR